MELTGFLTLKHLTSLWFHIFLSDSTLSSPVRSKWIKSQHLAHLNTTDWNTQGGLWGAKALLTSKRRFPHVTLVDKEDRTYYGPLSHFKRPLHLKVKKLGHVSACLQKTRQEAWQVAMETDRMMASRDGVKTSCFYKQQNIRPSCLF